jgi:hypothetical protein
MLGPRQIGKTTLAIKVAHAFNAVYVDLESPTGQAQMDLWKRSSTITLAGWSTVRVAPCGKSWFSTAIRQKPCGAHRDDHRAGGTDPDQMGMRVIRAEPDRANLSF